MMLTTNISTINEMQATVTMYNARDNMKHVTIGYQGTPGSNSEYAAIMLSLKLPSHDTHDRDITYVPLIGSDTVIASLVAGKIDYGVCAIHNDIGSDVRETCDALDKHADASIRPIMMTTLVIHHCLYRLLDVSDDDISVIASHEQALRQTRRIRHTLYQQCMELETPDTALAAAWLADGRLGRDVAVLCPRRAGERYGLQLMRANMKDKPSHTTFCMYAATNEND
jgi:prephenate dehydratase